MAKRHKDRRPLAEVLSEVPKEIEDLCEKLAQELVK